MKLSKWMKVGIIAPILVGSVFIWKQPEHVVADGDYTLDTNVIAVQNNKGTSDYITINELSTKDQVAIYTDAAMKKKIYSTTAKSSTLKIKTKSLKDAGGTLYVSIKHSWLSKADIGKLTYAASPNYTAPLQNTSTLELVNIKDGQDIFKIKRPIKNATYRVYEDAAKKKRLLQVTAKSTATISTNVEIPKDYSLHMPQTVYVTVQEKGKKESRAIDYTSVDPEGIAPLKASQVTITNNKNYADVIKITGLQTGDMITVRSTTLPAHNYVVDRKSPGSTMYIYIDQLSRKSKTLEILRTPANGGNHIKPLQVTYKAEK
ncbi:hypothetical protein QN089_02080 [Kurthia sp. YJT4]|uniref:hypothetical protein n=1 Tax=Kurthia sp. YJT4 TaxID=3049086 RepID=UPI00254E56E8|nr:hypothetical protein [Kurthia sp. YJT4]WIL39069.1 hypothetical protein QN089_02080 [Kurthia sp. YJT4]